MSALLSCSAWAIEVPADDLQAIMKHEGEFITVVGKVVGTHIASSGKVRFLNFGEDYRKAFTAVIFTGDLAKFTATVGEPTKFYAGKNVKVSGRIKIYKGKPEMILKAPDQIEESK